MTRVFGITDKAFMSNGSKVMDTHTMRKMWNLKLSSVCTKVL